MDDGKKVASLKRDAARVLAKVMDLGFSSDDCYLIKPKENAFFHSRRVGRAQVCNLGFRLHESKEMAIRNLLRCTALQYSVTV